MCDCLATPSGFDVTSVRALLQVWFGKAGLTNKNCFQWNDSDCCRRITETLPARMGLSKTVKTLGATFQLDAVLSAIGGTNFRDEPRVAAVRTTGKFAGANSKAFPGGFHYVLLFDKGKNLEGKPFCVVFDADVSCTPAAIQMWAECTAGKNPQDDATPTQDMLNKMIFGNGNQLGPLIRYYYGD